jgi:hypothetical protein
MPPVYQDPTVRINESENVKLDYIDDYLFLSIFNLFFCFFLGIPALIFSIQSRKHKRNQHFNESRINSILSKKFNIASLIVGSIILILIFFNLINEIKMYEHLLHTSFRDY